VTTEAQPMLAWPSGDKRHSISLVVAHDRTHSESNCPQQTAGVTAEGAYALVIVACSTRVRSAEDAMPRRMWSSRARETAAIEGAETFQ
jgi:hypothetical protein